MVTAEKSAKPVQAKKAITASGAMERSSKVAKMTYATMITKSLIEMKEKKGSSRQAIMKHLVSAYNVAPNTLMLNRVLKKMVEEGKLVAGAQAGKSGSGSFKVSNEEKARIKQEEKAMAKKLQKKVAASKPKKVESAKKSARVKKSKPSGAKVKVMKKTSKSKKELKVKQGGVKPKKVAKKMIKKDVKQTK